MNDVQFLRAAVMCGLALVLAGFAASAGAAPRVVVTLKPLHAIAANVMEGAGEPDLLLPGAATPHSTSLKPSQMRMLYRAEVIFWVGPELEIFLESPLAALSGSARIVPLLSALQRYREQGGEAEVWPNRLPEVWSETAPGPPAGGEAADPHIWLDPVNGAALASVMAEALAQTAPRHADLFRANAARFSAEMERLRARMNAVLAPVRARPFIVYHDSFQYLERRFGLRAVAAVTRSAHVNPGAAHLARLRALLEGGEAVCVFVEPQFSPRLARALVRGTPARLGTLDPLGGKLPKGPQAYSALLDTLTDSLASCLDRESNDRR